jgi:hypothetical protein
LHTAAAIALASIITAAPALADGPRASSSNTVSRMLRPQPAAWAPHYEWQYHYVGHNARYAGYWALVK